MRSILAALLAAFCGAAGCACPVCERASGEQQLIGPPLAPGSYLGSALRRGGQAPKPLPRSAHVLDCFNGSGGLCLQSFRIGAALQVGELLLQEPLLVATCPGAGALLPDQRSGSDWKSAGLFFEPAPEHEKSPPRRAGRALVLTA